MAKVEIR